MGRFIDKIRLRNAGQIQDYNYITVGFDKYLADFLGIDAKAFEQRVLAGGTDEELLAWVHANGNSVTEADKTYSRPGQRTRILTSGFKAGCTILPSTVACRFLLFLRYPPGPMS
ncbi:MAG: DUF5069 domain-containing protein [Nitrospira sp.]|nr:DUF5069 domain-containing protein [Nitrospira sp.]